MSLFDLRRDYLQVQVSESLWPFQTVMFSGKRYCLTRLGFGLNVTPQIMKVIINAVLSPEEKVKEGTSAYVDDIYVSEDIVSSLHVKAKLAQFGLIYKDPERLEDGARVLGLDVHGKQGSLQWRHRAVLPEVPHALTRRDVFSLCGILVRHLPVCRWLREVTGIMKCRASIVAKGWDEGTADALLIGRVVELVTRVKKNDPARGDWCMQGKEMNAWVDASSRANRVLLEKNGVVIKDACWLWPMNDAMHINLAELNTVLKGINLALQWGVKVLHVQTNSLCVYHRVSDTLSGKARV